MIKIFANFQLDEAEIELTYIRSPGPGGQNVNKVASGVRLRFNILKSRSLPENVRTRLLSQIQNKLTNQGDLIIKATRFRTQERNKQDALGRLLIHIQKALIPPKKRKKTKPSQTAIEKRLSRKKLRGKNKSLRIKKISPDFY